MGLLALCGIVMLAGGCGGTAPFVANPGGRTLVYEPGAPNFDMEALPTVVDGRTGVRVYLNIPRASLVFLQQGAQYRAGYEVLVRIEDVRGKRTLDEHAWTDTVTVASYAATQVFSRVPAERFLPLAPGRYRVSVQMEDTGSEAQAVRTQAVRVPDLLDGAPAVAGVHLRVRQAGQGWAPFTSLHLPAEYDSLRAAADLYNLKGRTELHLALVQYPSDTTAAPPPFWFSPSHGTLPYMGVDYTEGDTLQRTRRTLDDPEPRTEIEFALPPLGAGHYRLFLSATAGKGRPLTFERAFSVVAPNFPFVTSLDEMIEALVYIATEREMAELRAAATPEQQQAAFDAFWGGLIPNRQKAAAAVKQYFARVEEANIAYSGFKEGWKTDRGMIYVVMGMPVEVRDELYERVWRYSYNTNLWPDFIFRRVRPYGTDTLYDNFLLLRHPQYEEFWDAAVERWREGRAL